MSWSGKDLTRRWRDEGKGEMSSETADSGSLRQEERPEVIRIHARGTKTSECTIDFLKAAHEEGS